VARDSESCPRLLGDPRSVSAVHVPEVAIDGQDRDVECENPQPVAETGVRRSVPRVIDRPRAAADDEADCSSRSVVLRTDGREAEVRDRDSLVDVDEFGDDICVLHGERVETGRADKCARSQRVQRHRVEVVGVSVTGRDDVDEPEPCGIDDASRHPHVRGRRFRVLLGQRVRQVGVEEEIAVVELDEKPALAEPPEMQRTRGRLLDVAQEGVVGERRLDQAPTSSRTMATPRTWFASF
jgi:hypothetical protein